jgi:hypothetical protein
MKSLLSGFIVRVAKNLNKPPRKVVSGQEPLTPDE